MPRRPVAGAFDAVLAHRSTRPIVILEFLIENILVDCPLVKSADAFPANLDGRVPRRPVVPCRCAPARIPHPGPGWLSLVPGGSRAPRDDWRRGVDDLDGRGSVSHGAHGANAASPRMRPPCDRRGHQGGTTPVNVVTPGADTLSWQCEGSRQASRPITDVSSMEPVHSASRYSEFWILEWFGGVIS